jgi:hypothetical protein
MGFEWERSRNLCSCLKTSRSRHRSTASGGFLSFFLFRDSLSRAGSLLLGGRARSEYCSTALIICCRPHFGKGRQAVDQQRTHISVLSLGSAYKSRARLPEEPTLEELLEADSFERARSIVGSLLKKEKDGSEEVVVPKDIDTQAAKLVKHVDSSVFALCQMRRRLSITNNPPRYWSCSRP